MNMSHVFNPLSKGLLGLLCMLWVAAVQAQLPDFVDLVKESSPVVVNISTTQKIKQSRVQLPPGMQIPDLPEDSPFNDLFKHFFDQGKEAPEQEAKSLGSGFIISSDGYIMTNNHVVKDATEVIVRLSSRDEYEAQVIGTDARSDVALLKIDATDLPVAKLGDSDKLEVGEWVLAIGSPFGFERSATAGIVSAKGRALPNENYVPFIQTDVAINPGNSGGPLFNLDGEVVGINSQIFSRTGGYMGLSFAIPIDVAMDVAKQLKTSGHVSRGWLGVLIQDVTRELAESFGMEKPRGALISKVLPDSPAAEGGLKVGDIILKFDGKDVVTSSNLPPIVGSSPVGERVPVTILRNGKKKVLKIKLGELEEKQAAAEEAQGAAVVKTGKLGMVVEAVPDKLREDLELDKGGAYVEKVQSGPAAHAGIHEGDVIVRFGNKAVKGPDHLRELEEAAKPGSTASVLVQRRSGPLFMAVKIPE